ncbi:MAG: thioredoxin family protein [Carboxylicivirga sp.]|nr:thioredoxin family protein [Carboxylicivirga sp.]
MKIAELKYFSHDRCSVCKVLLPKIKHLLRTEFPRMEFQYINIEEEPQEAAKYNVYSAPTILVFFEGKEYYRFGRSISLKQLDEAIRRPYRLLF